MFEDLLRTRPAAPFDVALPTAALEEYREQGFTRIDRITSDEELEWLRRFYDGLFEERRGALPGGYFDLSRPYESGGEDLQPQIILPETRFPVLLETAFFHNGRQIAARLLDEVPEHLEVGGHMIRKPPRIGESLPWHQDEAYWDPSFAHEAVGVWMPLDPATLESGCMHFIPGSHRQDVMRHRHVGDDPNVHALVVAEPVDEAQGVPQPIPAGGASFHHCRLLHRSGPNRTGGVRRAYANEFIAPRVRRRERAVRPWFDQTREAWSQRDKVRALPTDRDA